MLGIINGNWSSAVRYKRMALAAAMPMFSCLCVDRFLICVCVTRINASV